MRFKKYGLTLRQIQALVSIAYRKKNLGIVKLTDLITDMGVSFSTLADHLDALKKLLYIETPENKNTYNLSFYDDLIITAKGEQLAGIIMKSINASFGDTPTLIFEKLKKLFNPTEVQMNLFNTPTKTASFAKAFEQLVKDNPTEPVLTSIAMYTDLDSQLNLMRSTDLAKYKTLSTVKLNLEIRNGRLASIVIPTAIRQTTKYSELRQILGDSWCWMGTVGATSNKRYWQEAMSLGLLQVRGDSLTSMKPTTIDTISWLAQKTHYTFINTIPTAPKSSLVVFRESFLLPSEEDLMNPQAASIELPWLNSIRENMSNKTDYIDSIKEGLKIVKDYANIVREYEGKIIPTTIIRKVSSDPEMETSFKTILKQSDQNMITGKILLAITAKPAITMYDLHTILNSKNTGRKIKIEDVEEIVSILVAKNLLQMSTSSSNIKQQTKLYSFIHLPFFTPKMAGHKETNAIFRSMKPYLLQRISDIFVTLDEKQAAYKIFSNFMKTKEAYFEDLEGEFGKIIHNKILILVNDLKPFVLFKEDYSGFFLNEKKRALNEILINSLLYSMLTQTESYESLGIYSQAISDLIEKDTPWAKEVEEEARILVEDITNHNIQTGFD